MEDDLWWRTAFSGRQPLKEGNHQWYMTFNIRRPFEEENKASKLNASELEFDTFTISCYILQFHVILGFFLISPVKFCYILLSFVISCYLVLSHPVFWFLHSNHSASIYHVLSCVIGHKGPHRSIQEQTGPYGTIRDHTGEYRQYCLGVLPPPKKNSIFKDIIQI